MVFAFDFFGTLDTNESVRDLARASFKLGHEVHIVSAISPEIPFDYFGALIAMGVPYTAVHRVDHVPALKVEVLKRIRADGFWDDVKENVDAARQAGFFTCHVGVDNPAVTECVGGEK
jgi:predicted ABC-type sugar transport system permease subunit